ncbi:hypothetical protein ACIQMJ_22265 [Actinosynnema sp. NPDC091369]
MTGDERHEREGGQPADHPVDHLGRHDHERRRVAGNARFDQAVFADAVAWTEAGPARRANPDCTDAAFAEAPDDLAAFLPPADRPS